MAMVLLCSPSLLPPHHFLRNQSRTLLSEKKCKLKEKILIRSCASSSSSSKPNSLDGFFRRDFVLFGLSSSISIFFPSLGSLAEEYLRMDSLVDEINAYTYLYPVELPSKKVIFKWVESRKPERYSSAAPLSPDARLRIVSERVDIIDNLIISVTFIKSKDKGTWTAKDVADSVLSDKSALRVTSSQRLAESSVLDTHTSVTDGEPYWYYEYLVRKSPTKIAQESNLYWHYISSTVERDVSTGKILFHWWNYIQLSLLKCSAYFADMASPFSGLLFTHKELNCRLSVYNKCFNS
ncbi:psbP domain-containing protein 5, chloroplastic isoform X3 [Hevea brasiliensis]|uniref:psbP domain-containing protein 5, chloroplastic isoform X3 n=1 Tax=Hevea brasiliensis TaxID=3981 RepID=UPI0025FFEAF3|nr:psbP domain-containing protein 5, chloroplastic isoform X3 [Hevea brasiliensis]